MDIRASLFILASLATACHSPQGEWHTEHVRAHTEQFCSARLFSKAKTPVRTVDIEFVRTASSLTAYLFVRQSTLPAIKGDPHHLQGSLEAKGQKISFTAYLLEGKQKCLLPQEATDFLIDSLNNNQEVIMMMNGYKRVFSPAHFAYAYREFMHKPQWEIPFQFKLE